MIAAADFSTIARAWEAAIFRASWQGGLALCLAWGVCHIWRNLPGSAKCWIWRLAYLKLLIALLWIAPIALPVLKPSHRPVSVIAQSASLQPLIGTASSPITTARDESPPLFHN